MNLLTSAWRALDTSAWVVFIGLVPILWLSGVRLFVNSALTRRGKIAWSAALVSVDLAIGFLLPLASIRNKCLLPIAMLPLLAAADIKLARSNRSFFFWFRACAFEVSTVFGSAALTRLVLDIRA
jgi:hypothetical protein